MSERVRVFIADDHPATREGLANLLEEVGIAIVGQTESGEDVVSQASTLKPDVVLLDVQMKHRDGLWALQQIREKIPEQRVIMLSAFADPIYLARSAALKANDYLLKDTPPRQLAAAIDRVYRDEPLPDESLLRRIRRPTSYRQRDEVNPLTDRETQVLRHISQGFSNTEIGKALGISVETVKEHVQNIIRKLDVEDRTQAAVWAVKSGII
ncbi:MAG: response regulator [Pirellulaceae bacterium]